LWKGGFFLCNIHPGKGHFTTSSYNEIRNLKGLCSQTLTNIYRNREKQAKRRGKGLRGGKKVFYIGVESSTGNKAAEQGEEK